jgi:dolichol kinase
MGIPRHYGHAKILGWIAIVGICILSHKDPMISLIFITNSKHARALQREKKLSSIHAKR